MGVTNMRAGYAHSGLSLKIIPIRRAMPYAVIFWAFSPTNRNYPGAISKNGINGESVKQIPREAYKNLGV